MNTFRDDLAKVFGPVDDAALAGRLFRVSGQADAVLDTDTYNEIDDQYALAYLVRSEKECRIRAITAAPFWSDPVWKRPVRSSSPEDGMERSYDEILRVLALMGRQDLNPLVFRGSRSYLPGPLTPVHSEAAEKIIEISREYSAARPLYVICLACLTNIASALLLDPTLRERIVVVWLGGHAHHFGTCDDFNCRQDMHASRLVFACGVPVVQLPLFGVISHFSFCKPELESLLRGKNALCYYLIDSTFEFAKKKFDYEHWSKPLWDICVAAWVVNPAFFLDRITAAPLFQFDYTCSFLPDMPPIRYVYYVFKDQLVADLVKKLAGQ